LRTGSPKRLIWGRDMVYLIVLYLHVLAALLLASAFTVEILSLWRMRATTNVREARLWVELTGKLPILVGISGLVLLFSGGYLTARMAAWTLAWPRAAVAGLLLMAPLGAVSGRRLRRIRKMLMGETNPSAVAGALNDLFLTFSLSLRLWLLGGIVLLMTVRPGEAASITILAASAVIGLAAAIGSRRQAALTALDAEGPTRG
jgi:hypothetical protein